VTTAAFVVGVCFGWMGCFVLDFVREQIARQVPPKSVEPHLFVREAEDEILIHIEGEL